MNDNIDHTTRMSICELFGLDPHNVISLDIHVRLHEAVTMTAEMFVRDDDGNIVRGGNEALTTVKTFTIEETT